LDIWFTSHAVQRAAQRLDIDGTPASVRVALGGLARTAPSRLVSKPPAWSRLKHDRPRYLVIADWVCCPVVPGRKHRWDATTVVTRNGMTWRQAHEKGLVPLPTGAARLRRERGPGLFARVLGLLARAVRRG
jgi:hypothetical protein